MDKKEWLHAIGGDAAGVNRGERYAFEPSSRERLVHRLCELLLISEECLGIVNGDAASIASSVSGPLLRRVYDDVNALMKTLVD